MFEKYFVIKDELDFLKGDYIVGFFGIMITTAPNFLHVMGHAIMIFTDMYFLKNYTDEVHIGGYGFGYSIVATFLFAMNCAVNLGL